MSNSNRRPDLFVWRHKYSIIAPDEVPLYDNCIYCNSKLRRNVLYEYKGDEPASHIEYEEKCIFCGWKYFHMVGGGMNFQEEEADFYGLIKFDTEDPQLAVNELGAYLKKNFSHIYSISPRKFEELIADVFKEFGYSTILSPETRDGGVDIYLLGRESNEYAIVECKRYSRNRKVGVYAVDRLLGTTLVKGSKHAYLVTTSSFTKPALQHASSPYLSKSGIKLDLVDAGEILNMLNVYNGILPPLHIELNKRWEEQMSRFKH